ncbi:phytochelatin synthase family protein [Limnofasciculus baicalensis]|uniref:glutathione gamma-glutamylcysteinyltransferase n=1 Tax=Limnofasciculus baicalensis BBK-W-15 TaxID=2699891 RepID=A0AAE3GX98_9CYAN|nr:phytochelatin synthase family protein [Limnofasciculus baicalensis]MCP2730312.1 phytochelatin synthase family protein [Limnofasciculus baicalensis BBK-W-15]
MNGSKYQKSLVKGILILLKPLILGFCLANGRLSAQTLAVSSNLISLNSAEGETLLIESKSRQDYLPLSIHFETQDNLAYCGVASMVMVLNTLSIPAPVAPEFGTYHIFTQNNIWNDRTEKILSSKVIARQGMTLEQLGQLLETYPVKAQVYHGDNVSLDEFRNLAIANLQDPNNFILVNYLRKAINQESGGHISPLAAYNEQTDRFLILDVSRYKYPPVWVKAEELWQGMKTIDAASGKMRGFVSIARQGE